MVWDMMISGYAHNAGWIFNTIYPMKLSFQPKIMICTDNQCIVIFAAVGSYSINVRYWSNAQSIVTTTISNESHFFFKDPILILLYPFSLSD